MKSRDYWRKRFEILENSEHMKAVEYASKLDEAYRKASKKAQNDINLWYARFANNNEISMAEARKLLTAGELEEFKWTVEEYIKNGHLPEQFEKQLENASAKVHITRLEALKMQMQEHVETMYYDEEQGLTNLLERIYTDGYYRTAYEVQKGIGVGYSLMKLDKATVEKVVRKPWAQDGANFSSRIWKSKADLVNKLHTDLTQAVILGKNPNTLIDGVAKRFDVSRSQAGRLVNTEASFIYSASTRDSYKELDVEEYEILATLDNKTSETCQGMDGEHFPLSQYEIGITAPPFHPNCRTTTVPYFNDEFTEGETRAYRNEDTDYGLVPADMKYPEWKEKYLKKPDVPAEEKQISELTKEEAEIRLKELNNKLDLLQNEWGEIMNGEISNESWERLKDVQSEINDIKNSEERKALQDRINALKSAEKKTFNQQNAVKIQKANIKGKDILSRAYENHRIENNLKAASIADVPETVSVEYRGLSGASADVFNKTFEELIGEYDTTLQHIRCMTPLEYTGKKDSFAFVLHEYHVDRSTLVINPAKCNDITKLRERIEECATRGHCANIDKKFADKYVATHEFAHTLFNTNSKLNDKTNWLKADYAKVRNARKEIEILYDEYKNAVQDNISMRISKYSMENADEFLAESFASVRLGAPKNKYAEGAVKIINKYFKR